MPFPKHLFLLALVAFSAVAGSQAEIKVQRNQKVSTDQLQANLLFEALRTVLKAHEQDPAFTPALARDELQKAFAQQIKEAAK